MQGTPRTQLLGCHRCLYVKGRCRDANQCKRGRHSQARLRRPQGTARMCLCFNRIPAAEMEGDRKNARKKDRHDSPPDRINQINSRHMCMKTTRQAHVCSPARSCCYAVGGAQRPCTIRTLHANGDVILPYPEMTYMARRGLLIAPHPNSSRPLAGGLALMTAASHVPGGASSSRA